MSMNPYIALEHPDEVPSRQFAANRPLRRAASTAVAGAIAYLVGGTPFMGLTGMWPAPVWYAHFLAAVSAAAGSRMGVRPVALGVAVGAAVATGSWYFGTGAFALHHYRRIPPLFPILELALPPFLMIAMLLTLHWNRLGVVPLFVSSCLFALTWLGLSYLVRLACTTILWVGNYDAYGLRLGAGVFITTILSTAPFQAMRTSSSAPHEATLGEHGVEQAVARGRW